jgi:hypothetical protein
MKIVCIYATIICDLPEKRWYIIKIRGLIMSVTTFTIALFVCVTVTLNATLRVNKFKLQLLYRCRNWIVCCRVEVWDTLCKVSRKHSLFWRYSECQKSWLIMEIRALLDIVPRSLVELDKRTTRKAVIFTFATAKTWNLTWCLYVCDMS